METDNPRLPLEHRMRSITRHADGKLLAGRIGQVGVMLFNRPEKLNAINGQMWDGVAEVLGKMERDDDVRVVIYAGVGGKAFTAGADISELPQRRIAAQTAEGVPARIGGKERLTAFPKPTIACIQGFCLGGGLVVAMQADLRVAAHDAVFGVPAARLGVHFPLQYTEQLVSLIGPSRARLMLYTARQFASQEALEMGLVDVIAAKDVAAESVELARTIAANAPLSVLASKFTVDQTLKEPAQRDLSRVDAHTRRCINSADFIEGQNAFKDKRIPVFTGS